MNKESNAGELFLRVNYIVMNLRLKVPFVRLNGKSKPRGETMSSSDSANLRLTTVVTVPCFSGAPWDLEKLQLLSQFPLKTIRLPEALDDIEQYAEFLAEQVSVINCYVLVGDSFGAIISLAFATRQPPGLRTLVLSGGFAGNPVRNPLLKARIRAARFLPGPRYRTITLRMHAAWQSSPYDSEGQVPWSKSRSRELFRENTPYRSYVACAKAALEANYLYLLEKIIVPTLIITPEHDTLMGERTAKEMLNGIPDASEVVLKQTGHRLRFSHPLTYAETVRTFLEKQFDDELQRACS
jgi:pimeloyl-ACP methyl ester carboxylesterase